MNRLTKRFLIQDKEIYENGIYTYILKGGK